MTAGKPLWGWLDQADNDPLAGKPMAENYIRQMLGLPRLKLTEPLPFDPAKLRPSRLTQRARKALRDRHGDDWFSDDALLRARKSLGQSYPDQIQRRLGVVESTVDAVVTPSSVADALDLLLLAKAHKLRIQATGGATNVTGAFQPPADRRPVIAADMTRLNQVIEISESDKTVTAEAGILLPDLEEALSGRGLTLGHFPQSFHGATLGGSIACNGAGQRSDGYGRLSDNLVSAVVATPAGVWRTEPFRHGSEGPWLGGLLAGSEGLLGLICTATLKVRAKPQTVEDRAWFFPSFEAGADVIRTLSQEGHRLSMLRLSDEDETGFLSGFQLAMAGKRQPGVVRRAFLSWKRAPGRPVLLLAGFEGGFAGRAQAFARLGTMARERGAAALGLAPGASWRKGRYDLPYLRESLMRRGLGIDTFETAAPWSRIADLKAHIAGTLGDIAASTLGADPGRAAVMCHLSHSHPEGASLYFTLLFPRGENALRQWRMIKSAVNDAISAYGGAASHHHGVGADHADAAALRKGEIGIRMLAALKQELDPHDVLASGMKRMLPPSQNKAKIGRRPS